MDIYQAINNLKIHRYITSTLSPYDILISSNVNKIDDPEAVHFTPQLLTVEQREQVLANLGITGDHFHYVVLPELPEVGVDNALYLIGPKGEGEDADLYEEYVYYEEEFVKIGDTAIDLSQYATKQELSDGLAEKEPVITDGSIATSKLNPLLVNAISVPADFSPNKPYVAGNYVSHENKTYRFLHAHSGEWSNNDVIESSLFGALNDIYGTDKETLRVHFSSSDNQLVVSGIQMSVEVGGVTSVYTADSSGIVTVQVDKGREFTLIFQQQTGYQTISPIKQRALSNEDDLYITYQSTLSGNCIVTVTATLMGEPLTPSQMAEFEGKKVSLTSNGGASTSTFVDGVATFTMNKGLSGVVVCPMVPGYKTPLNISFNTDFNTQSVTANYTSLSDIGFTILRDDGIDIDPDDYDSEDTYLAIHVAPSTLANVGCDFYIRIDDLTATTIGTSKYAEPEPGVNNALFPGVNQYSSSNPDYDGKLSTNNMLLRASEVRQVPLIAQYATGIKLIAGNREADGFVGTRDQMQVLYDNYENINSILTKMGLTGKWYNKAAWTISQYNAAYSWYWNGSDWYNVVRSTRASVFPLFAF